MLDAKLGATGRTLLRTLRLNRGEIQEAHDHPFAHDTCLATGKIQHIDGRVLDAKNGPVLFEVLAHAQHGWTALEDGTVTVCIIQREDWEAAYGPLTGV